MPVDLNALPLKHAVSYLKITWTSSHHRCWIRCRASSIPRQAREGNKLPSRAAGWGMEWTGVKRGPVAHLKHTRRDFFFSGWLSMAFFTCLCTIQLVFLASQSMVDQQPFAGRANLQKPTLDFSSSPQNNAILCLFWGQKTLRQGLSGGGGKTEQKY